MKKLIIGRAPDCDIVINDQYVSRRHCQLNVYGNGRCSVNDLNSKTGTFVNGNKIFNEQFLNDNDQLKVGLTNVPWQRYVSSASQKYKSNEPIDLDRTKRVVLDKKKNLKEKLPLILGSVGGLLLVLGVLYYFFLFHPMKTFDKSYGNYEDVLVSSICQTSDDGYVYCGEAFDEDDNYLSFISKIDKEGNKVWSNDIYKVEDKTEIVFINSMSNTSDNGFILVGNTNADNNDYTFTKVIKLNSLGNIVWEKNIINNEGNIIGNSIIETNEGGYILTGKKYLDYNYKLWVYKMDADGNKEWDKRFGGNENDEGNRIKQLDNGDYVIVGSTKSKGRGSSDVWVIYLDKDGSKVWNKTYGGKDYDSGKDIVQTEDDGFMILGNTDSKSKGSSDVYLIKTDNEGKKEWTKKFGGKSLEEAVGLLQDDDGYIIGANTKSEGEGSTDGWVIRTNEEGEKQWDRTFGGEQKDTFTDMIRTSDGGMAFVGITKSKDEGERDIWVLKLNDEGKLKKK